MLCGTGNEYSTKCSDAMWLDRISQVNTKLTVSCKLVEIFAMICAVFFIKSSPRFHCILAINPAVSVARIESLLYSGASLWCPSLWQTTIGWTVNAGWLIPLVDKHVDGR